MATARKTTKKNSPDKEEAPKKESAQQTFANAFAGCPQVDAIKLADVFQSFSGKSIQELASTVGTADTIMLSQTMIYIKRNYPTLHETMLNDIVGYTEFANFVKAASAISKTKKSKDVW